IYKVIVDARQSIDLWTSEFKKYLDILTNIEAKTDRIACIVNAYEHSKLLTGAHFEIPLDCFSRASSDDSLLGAADTLSGSPNKGAQLPLLPEEIGRRMVTYTAPAG
ncbi:hypothetical protein T265_14997, partial [Opisthorchis viverrini]